ncbi:MAG: hypothetical protein ACE5GJ_06810 [Gemmatimonadota bacterium]
MYTHFALARDLCTFVVAGDLERLRVTAHALADQDESWGVPPGSEGYARELQERALSAAQAPGGGEAARAVAELAQTCGRCHIVNKVALGERFQTAAPFLDDPRIRHRNYLSWASRLLWDGLVGPSDRTWSTGAGALAGDDGFPPPAAQHVPGSVIAAAGARLRSLGVEAAESTDPTERARILADIWTECADCHVQAGVR